MTTPDKTRPLAADTTALLQWKLSETVTEGLRDTAQLKAPREKKSLHKGDGHIIYEANCSK